MSDPHSVLHAMEDLATHVMRELLELRRQQRVHAEEETQSASRREKKRLKSGLDAKVKAEASGGASASCSNTAAAAAAASASSSAAPAPKPSRARSRTNRAKSTIVIQYQTADKNSTRDENGVLRRDETSSTSAQTAVQQEQKAAAAAEFGAACASASSISSPPSSRWAATPRAPLSGRKQKSKSAGSNSKRSRSASSVSGSQVDDSQPVSSSQGEPLSQTDREASQGPEESEEGGAGGGSQEGEVERQGSDGRSVKSRQLVYPSRHGHKQLACLLTHLATCYIKMQNSSRGNIRELFYDDKQLFRSKSYSDGSLRLLSQILQLPRDALGLVATAKGLVMGDLQFELEDFVDEAEADGESAPPLRFEIVDCRAGHPIPVHVKQIKGMSCGASWLLLVEKDTVYSKIAQSGYQLLNNCLLVTDKGMPSYATCNFLSLFHSRFPSIPMWGLFDADPDGVGIYKEYKYGSASSGLQKSGALPDLQLLGVSIRDVESLGVLEQTKLALTERDRARIRNMLASDIGERDGVIRSELESMLELDCKAEIESLSHVSEDYLTGRYLREKKQRLQAEAHMRARVKGEEEEEGAVASASAAASPPGVKMKQLESASSSSASLRAASMDAFDRASSGGSPLMQMDLDEWELADEFAAEASDSRQARGGAQGDSEADTNTLNEDSPWLN